MPEPLDSVKEGRLGDETVGLIDDGGVTELWEEVSIVEEDLPETISTLADAFLESGAWILALERRRSCLKNGMLEDGVEGQGLFSPGEERPLREEQLPLLGRQEQESATVCGG